MVTRIDGLLAELCTDLGFCLPPEAQARLAETPPATVDAFTDAVFVEEGWDPVHADPQLRMQVRERVSRYFKP